MIPKIIVVVAVTLGATMVPQGNASVEIATRAVEHILPSMIQRDGNGLKIEVRKGEAFDSTTTTLVARAFRGAAGRESAVIRCSTRDRRQCQIVGAKTFVLVKHQASTTQDTVVVDISATEQIGPETRLHGVMMVLEIVRSGLGWRVNRILAQGES